MKQDLTIKETKLAIINGYINLNWHEMTADEVAVNQAEYQILMGVPYKEAIINARHTYKKWVRDGRDKGLGFNETGVKDYNKLVQEVNGTLEGNKRITKIEFDGEDIMEYLNPYSVKQVV